MMITANLFVYDLSPELVLRNNKLYLNGTSPIAIQKKWPQLQTKFVPLNNHLRASGQNILTSATISTHHPHHRSLQLQETLLVFDRCFSNCTGNQQKSATTMHTLQQIMLSKSTEQANLERHIYAIKHSVDVLGYIASFEKNHFYLLLNGSKLVKYRIDFKNYATPVQPVYRLCKSNKKVFIIRNIVSILSAKALQSQCNESMNWSNTTVGFSTEQFFYLFDKTNVTMFDNYGRMLNEKLYWEAGLRRTNFQKFIVCDVRFALMYIYILFFVNSLFNFIIITIITYYEVSE